MPNTLLFLHSAQRKTLIPDRPDAFSIRGRLSGKVPGIEIDWSPGRLRWNAIPDTYELRVEIPEFKRGKAAGINVGKKPSAQKILVPSRCTKLPTRGQLGDLQRRLLRTFKPSKEGAEIWAGLSDNARATFFQVTYALSQYQLQTGVKLSEYIRRVVRIGGSEMIGPHPKKPGKKITVVGWRTASRRTMERHIRLIADSAL